MSDPDRDMALILRASGHLLNWAAQAAVDRTAENRREVLEAVVQTLSAVVDAELKLFAGRPDLRPPELLDGPAKGPVYDAASPVPPELRRKLEIAQAIEFFEAVCASGKNMPLADIARRELEHLRTSLNET